MGEKVKVQDRIGGPEEDAEIVHEFRRDRVVLLYRGIYAMGDRIGPDRFELSGNAATPEELPVLNRFVRGIEGTTTTVTRDE